MAANTLYDETSDRQSEIYDNPQIKVHTGIIISLHFNYFWFAFQLLSLCTYICIWYTLKKYL